MTIKACDEPLTIIQQSHMIHENSNYLLLELCFFLYRHEVLSWCRLKWNESCTGACHAYSASSVRCAARFGPRGFWVTDFQNKNCLGQQKLFQTQRGMSVRKEHSCFNHRAESWDETKQRVRQLAVVNLTVCCKLWLQLTGPNLAFFFCSWYFQVIALTARLTNWTSKIMLCTSFWTSGFWGKSTLFFFFFSFF